MESDRTAPPRSPARQVFERRQIGPEVREEKRASQIIGLGAIANPSHTRAGLCVEPGHFLQDEFCDVWFRIEIALWKWE